jgi:hypothetical protein
MHRLQACQWGCVVCQAVQLPLKQGCPAPRLYKRLSAMFCGQVRESRGSCVPLPGRMTSRQATSTGTTRRHTRRRLLQGGLDVGVSQVVITMYGSLVLLLSTANTLHAAHSGAARLGVARPQPRPPALCHACTAAVVEPSLCWAVGCRWSRLARTIAFRSQLFSRFQRAFWRDRRLVVEEQALPCVPGAQSWHELTRGVWVGRIAAVVE